MQEDETTFEEIDEEEARKAGLVTSTDPIEGAEIDESAFAGDANVPVEDVQTRGLTPGERRRKMTSHASWSNTYLKEFGCRGPGSRPKMDLRPPIMVTRGRSNVTACSNCCGTGMATCSICGGMELLTKKGELFTCPGCQGSVKRTCSICYGKGFIGGLTDKWWETTIEEHFERLKAKESEA